jgi:hypothetical protein
MSPRNELLSAITSEKLGVDFLDTLTEEAFQNNTLRPILKFQNELLLQVFINHAIKQKGIFFTLSPDKKEKYIENVIQKDIKFRNALKGVIIGLFTVEEYSIYIKNSSNLNKRMMTLLIERYRSQIQLLVSE